MKLLYSLFAVFIASTCFAQIGVPALASNRIIQKYQTFDRLQKIENGDPNRLEALWNYFTASYTFESNIESNLTPEKLLNVYHFDVYQFENQRLENESYTFQLNKSVSITLLPKQVVLTSIAPYDIEELVHGIPARPIPLWTASTFSPDNFQAYKEKIWEWAKDFPEEYLTLTADPSIVHVSFNNLSRLDETRRSEILSYPIYFIVD